jgi:hypothetical protein
VIEEATLMTATESTATSLESLLTRPAGGAGDQPLLDGQQVGSGPTAFF